MDSIGKHILETQNKSSHIDELLAQRRIYSIAKNYWLLLIVITVLVPIILAVVIKVFPEINLESTWIFALYTVLAAIAGKIIESIIDRFKKIAASIQEEFDTSVLHIERNETLNTVLVDKEIIRRFSIKNKKLKAVENWYSTEIESLETNLATLLCQRTNVTYNFSVRKRYGMLIRLLVIFTFIILLVISLANDIDIRAFLIEVILPSIPIFIFSYGEVHANNESIDNLENLKKLIESKLNDVGLNDSLEFSLLRNIQDRIYISRSLSPLIPDFIYYVLQPKLEDEMNYSIEEKLKILLTTNVNR